MGGVGGGFFLMPHFSLFGMTNIGRTYISENAYEKQSSKKWRILDQFIKLEPEYVVLSIMLLILQFPNISLSCDIN